MRMDKEVLNDFKENYQKVRKLLDEDSKLDPKNEPFLSKYAARAILVHMKHTLTCLISNDPPESVKLKAMLGAVLLNIGTISIDTEELSDGEKALTEAVNILQPIGLEPEVVVTLISAYNNLGLLWSSRDDISNTKKNLTFAKNVYSEFKSMGKIPVFVDCLFGLDREDCGIVALEKAYTFTLYYLAQVYGTLKDNLKSGIYCHITLKRQLEYGDYDPIDWALNAATLSQFFAEKNGFVQCRNHLAAASTVLKKHEVLLLAEESGTEEHDARVEVWKHRSADVARCWAKYCLMLLTASKVRLMEDVENDPPVTDLSNLHIEDDLLETSLTNLKFSNMDVSEFEEKVTANFILTFDDARKVFIECQNWLNKAKEYYKLDTLASDYIEIVQDHSQAYSNLLFFEDDDERQAKMHKRRINMLEDLLKEINPTYYLQYCRQLWYELGEIYTDILNLKLDKLKTSTERPTPHLLMKINNLAEQSIVNLELFLNSIKDSSTGSLPAKLEPDYIKPVITAYAYIGRNYMKIITPDKKIQQKNIIKSLEAYKKVVDYCDSDESASETNKETFSLCREMVTILPLKIKKLESEIMSAE